MADFNPGQAPGTHVKDVHDIEDSELAEREIRFGAFFLLLQPLPRYLFFKNRAVVFMILSPIRWSSKLNARHVS